MNSLTFEPVTSIGDFAYGSRLLPGFFRTTISHKQRLVATAQALTAQSTSHEVLAHSRNIAPSERVIDAYSHPLELMAVDFALTDNGEPQLVELQAFSSIHATTLLIEQQYGVRSDLDGASVEERILWFQQLLNSREGLAVILDIHPLQQMTTFDFLHARELFGVTIASLQQIERIGDSLYMKTARGLQRISTIWNRVVPSDIPQNELPLFRQLLSGACVRWIGHMDHFFSVSKASMPLLSGPHVPQCGWLNEYAPSNTDIVIKPLYDFGGSGVIISPTLFDIQSMGSQSIWQEKIKFGRCANMNGNVFCAEVRVMLLKVRGDWRALSLMARISEDGRSNQTGARQALPGGFSPLF